MDIKRYHPYEYKMDIKGDHPCLRIKIKWISKDALPASLHRLPGELGLHRDCPDVYLEQD